MDRRLSGFFASIIKFRKLYTTYRNQIITGRSDILYLTILINDESNCYLSLCTHLKSLLWVSHATRKEHHQDFLTSTELRHLVWGLISIIDQLACTVKFVQLIYQLIDVVCSENHLIGIVH